MSKENKRQKRNALPWTILEISPVRTIHLRSRTWVQVFESADGTQYSYVGPLLHATGIQSSSFIRAQVGLEQNKYGTYPIYGAHHAANPDRLQLPEKIIATIKNIFLEDGDVYSLLTKGYLFRKKTLYINEINTVSRIADLADRRKIAKLLAWLKKNAYETVEWYLTNTEGERRKCTVKIHYNGRVAVDDGNFRPLHTSDKGLYVNIDRKRWYLPIADSKGHYTGLGGG
jgi:hypothetical protein